MKRILIVEDEPNIVDVVKAYVRNEGYEALVAFDGEEGLERFYEGRPDAVILDVMLPHKDGFEVLRQIRKHSDVPVIMLTARVEEIDRVLGLELGADDYVLKPFSPRELVARLKAIFRRSERKDIDQVLRVGRLSLDTARHIARADQTRLELTPAEFALLEKMMRETGRAFSRHQLLDAFDQSLDGLERNVDTHIKNLRRKIGRVLPETYIHTVYGVGYRIDDPKE